MITSYNCICGNSSRTIGIECIHFPLLLKQLLVMKVSFVFDIRLLSKYWVLIFHSDFLLRIVKFSLQGTEHLAHVESYVKETHWQS